MMISKFINKSIKFSKYFYGLKKQYGIKIAIITVKRNFIKKYIFKIKEKINKTNPTNTEYIELNDFYNNHMSFIIPIIPTLPKLGRNPTVNLLLPTVTKENSFAGVATALIFSMILSKSLNYKLRILCTDQFSKDSSVSSVIKNYKVDFNIKDIDILDLITDIREIDIRPDDIFIATAWWTAKILEQMPLDKYLYFIQDYEALFYPEGDYTTLVNSTYRDQKSLKIFNTELLFDYFKNKSIINYSKSKYTYFEPAFPKNIFKPGLNLKNDREKRNLFFYARPSVPRNSFLTGIKALFEAFDRKILDINNWEIYFAGEDNLPSFTLQGKPIVNLGKLSFEKYISFLGNIDLAISLMASPHPSYPPLEVASSGGVVITNKFSNKFDLDKRYSQNILMSDFDVDSIVNTIRKFSKLSKQEIYNNYRQNKFLKDWNESFQSTIKLIIKYYGKNK